MWKLLVICTAALLVACPGYQDRLSGTYRQSGESIDPSEELIEIEVFRYGDNVQGLVRFYDPNFETFDAERRCKWTEPALLEKDRSFTARVLESDSAIRLTARFEEDGTLSAKFNEEQANTPDLTLELVTNEPDPSCSTIAGRSVTAKFGTSGNEFADGVYAIENPYLGVQWIAVQLIQTGDVGVWTAFVPELVDVPIQSKVTASGRGLRGDIRIPVEPPGEDYRTQSGATRYAIAHFIVVDDEPDDEEFVAWDIETEPIIASGVRGIRRPDAPPIAEDHTHSGQVLLFVEGSLEELGGLRDLITLREIDLDGDGEVEVVNPNAHFYVADVYAEGESIIALQIEPKPSLSIAVTVTTEYLDATSLPLPRLFPVD